MIIGASSRQWLIPGGGFIDERGTEEYLVLGIGFVNEHMLQSVSASGEGGAVVGGAAGVKTGLSGFTYRKQISLSRASGAVTNYQMKLLVGESSGATGEDIDCGGLCSSDFKDIRFTKADGITLLDYWIESVTGATPNQLATIWVEFDSIGTSATTFYMYYGNSSATAVSNGDNTFKFFDDFSGASIDTTNKWTAVSSGYAVSSGNLVATGGGSRGILVSQSKFACGARIRLTASGGNGVQQIASLVDNVDDSDYSTFMFFNSTHLKNETRNGGSVYSNENVDCSDISSTRVYEHLWSSNRVEFTQDGSSKHVNTSNVPDEDLYLQLVESSTTGVDGTIGWIFAANYQATEPAWGSWGSQEATLVVTAAGGAIAGGAAADVEWVPADEETQDVTATVAGGALAGGTSLPVYIRSELVAGGMVAGGTATKTNTHTITESVAGGAVIGGTATKTQLHIFTGNVAGGTVAGGTATKTNTYTITESVAGGAVTGGTATKTQLSVFTGNVAGGAIAGGACTETWIPVDQLMSVTGSGGMVAGGTAVPVCGAVKSAVGGAVAGGSWTETVLKVFTPTGGSVAGGAADSFLRVAIPIPAGGAVIGGSAIPIRTAIPTPSGGAVCGGAGTMTHATAVATYTATGGAVVGGSATVYVKAFQVIAGGGVTGGQGTIGQQICSRMVSGGSVGGCTAHHDARYISVDKTPHWHIDKACNPVWGFTPQADKWGYLNNPEWDHENTPHTSDGDLRWPFVPLKKRRTS